MRSISFGRLLLDGQHISGLGFVLEDARLAAAVQATGVVAKPYSGKAEGQVSELVRQLLRMRTDAYAFGVEAGTALATARLAAGLRELNPNSRFVYWGDAAALLALNGAAAANDLLAEGTVAEDVAVALWSWAGVTAEGARYSPYLTGLVPSEDVARMGLTVGRNPEELIEELRWATTAALPADSTITLHAEHCGADELAALGVMLVDARPERLMLRVAATAVTAGSTTKLAALPLAGLVVTGTDQVPEILASIPGAVRAEGAEADRLRVQAYGRNGCLLMHTGAYFDARTPGVQHVQVSAEMSRNARQAAYNWIGNSLLIRSAAVVDGPAENVERIAQDLREAVTAETGGWPKHVYALARSPESDGDTARVTFDDRTEPMHVDYVPLRSWNGAAPVAGNTTMVTIREQEDVVELERRLARFHSEGLIDVAHPDVSVTYENLCRWMGVGACKLGMLRRLQVDAAGQVRNCRDAGQVGAVGDSYDRMLTRARQHQQLEEARRGCATCIARDSCSHCSQLPEEWGGRYCELRNTYPLTALYFELNSFPYFLNRSTLPSGAFLELTVSAAGLAPRHFRGITGKKRDRGRPLVVTLAGYHYAWWRGTRRIVRISAPLATMAEAWWEGADEADTQAFLSEQFAVTRDVAASSLALGLEKLRLGGVIHA